MTLFMMIAITWRQNSSENQSIDPYIYRGLEYSLILHLNYNHMQQVKFHPTFSFIYAY